MSPSANSWTGNTMGWSPRPPSKEQLRAVKAAEEQSFREDWEKVDQRRAKEKKLLHSTLYGGGEHLVDMVQGMTRKEHVEGRNRTMQVYGVVVCSVGEYTNAGGLTLTPLTKAPVLTTAVTDEEAKLKVVASLAAAGKIPKGDLDKLDARVVFHA